MNTMTNAGAARICRSMCKRRTHRTCQVWRPFQAGCALLVASILVACGGGISGTGDGGPIIAINNPSIFESHSISDNNDADNAIADNVDAENSEGGGGDSGSSAGDVDGGGGDVDSSPQMPSQIDVSPESIDALLPTKLHGDWPTALRLADTSNPDAATSILAPLINAAAQAMATVAESLQNLQPRSSEIFAICNDAQLCDSTFESGANTLTISRFAATDTPPYLRVLEFSSADQFTVRLLWDTNTQTVETLYSDRQISFTLLYNSLSGEPRTTLRVLENTVPQALSVIFQSVTGSTLIEADWHSATVDDRQVYMRGLAAADNTILFARHPVDQSRSVTSREITTSDGRLLSLQICQSDNVPCDLTNSNNNFVEQINDPQSSVSQLYNSARNELGGFDTGLATDLTVSNIADSVSDFVVSSATDALSVDASNTLCSGQRFDQSFRTFCWSATINPANVHVFEERYDRGSINWQLLE